ncbi:hypothetical protein GCM10023330_14560 [Litoribaculum gwangyangense]|uniref:Uncharacterized protein n=2 Tax=Litoribaculum gwangyangense TaxID=1130722 RepID=A0ABP9CEJ5_9FLAO
MQYESTAKKFLEACKEHKVQTSWAAATTNDMKYLYITPMENFAELDKSPFADMSKAMGEDFGKMFEDFDKCYDSHSDYIIALDETLTYMPDGISMTQEGQNYRKWFYMYYKPENGGKLREGMKAVKDLFTSKNSPEHYRVYSSAFGCPESFYLVAISYKDEIDAATKSKANEKLLGTYEERWEVFSKVMNNIDRMEEYTGEMRPDLAYSPN